MPYRRRSKSARPAFSTRNRPKARGSDQRAFAPRTQCRQIAVIVVVVTQEHRRNRRQIVEANARLAHTSWPDPREGTCALRVYRVGDDVPRGGLNEECCMTNERNDRRCAIQRWRHPWSNFDVSRPRRPRLAQHPRNLGERLPGTSARVNEAPAVEVIAHVPALRSSFSISEGTSKRSSRCK
jgi:hypothetical protein